MTLPGIDGPRAFQVWALGIQISALCTDFGIACGQWEE